MRTPQIINPLIKPIEDSDDIFGPPRSGYYTPRNRPSMISPKYKQKEERRKILKMSLHKLKKIDDPEASLCRSVLINNTMKRLQQETRDEKVQKHFSYPRCYNKNRYLNIKTEFLKNETFVDKVTNDKMDDMFIEKEFHAELEEEINHARTADIGSLNCLESSNDFIPPQVTQAKESNSPPPTKKRTFDDIDECNVQDVLSQFFMPQTPKMLTAIDDDINVDSDPLCKRLKYDEQKSDIGNGQNDLSTLGNYTNSVTQFFNNNLTLSRYSNSCGLESDSNFSCGHASLLGELHGNVYHNLIASLET